MPLEGRHTAEVFGFLNKLGDAYNGKVAHYPNSECRTLMTDTSFHVAFFKEPKAKLMRMRFVDRQSRIPSSRQPPSMQNLLKTTDLYNTLDSGSVVLKMAPIECSGGHLY